MKFNYQARTKEGETQTGMVEAGSREAAIETLQRHDLVVIFLEELSEMPLYTRSLKIFQRIKPKEITIFYRQLAILFEASVSPLDALRILAEQTNNQLFKDLIFEVEQDVRGGETLSHAMSKRPKVFSPFYVNVVRAGEATGKLHEVLRYLADHAEREYNLTFKVRGAFTYPIAILSLFVVVGTLMMIFVVPQLTSMLEELGTELPITTKILIGASELMKSFWWLLAIILGGSVFGIIRATKTEKGRRIIDILKLKIPVFKGLFQKIYLARFSENFKTLLVGGIPILQALDITSTVIGNSVYEKIIQEAKDRVRVGKTIASAFSGYPKQFTPMLTQMVAVGEKTAALEPILDKVAMFYQQEVDRMVSNMTQLIEPMMILVLGAGVGFLVASILMPIYNIGSSL
ncbi:MAG: type II secretion system F family protein [bacterium]|nr:type II secretion system F family protein [bacterium]